MCLLKVSCGTSSASPDILTAAVFTWMVVIEGDVRSEAKLSKHVRILNDDISVVSSCK